MTADDSAARARSPRDQTMEASFAARLQHLFNSVMGPNGLPYKPTDLVDALHDAGVPLAERVVERLLAGIGEPPTDSILDAIADFFGVEPDFLTRDAPDTVTQREPHIQSSNVHTDAAPVEATSVAPDSWLDATELVVSVRDVGRLVEALSSTALECHKSNSAELVVIQELTRVVADLGSRLVSVTSDSATLPRSLLGRLVLAWAAAGVSDSQWRETFLWVAELLGRRRQE